MSGHITHEDHDASEERGQMSRDAPRQDIYAAYLFNAKGNQPAEITMCDQAKITLKAKSHAPGKMEVLFADGLANINVVDGSTVDIGAIGSRSDDDQTMEFVTQLESAKVFTMPHEKIVEFVKELRESHGISSGYDLADADLEKLRQNLKSLKGVQLTKFLKYAQSLKRADQQPSPSTGTFASNIS